MIWSGWAIPTCSKMLHEMVWGLQWDQNTPIKEVLSPCDKMLPREAILSLRRCKLKIKCLSSRNRGLHRRLKGGIKNVSQLFV